MTLEGILGSLKDYQEICIKYSEIHKKDGKSYSTWNTVLNICSICITSFSATVTAVTGNITPSSMIFNIDIISAILLYLSATMNAFQQILNFEKKTEQSKTASTKFIALSHNIQRAVTIRDLNNDSEIIEYFKWVTSEFDNIVSDAPSISKTFNIPMNTEFNNESIRIAMELHDIDRTSVSSIDEHASESIRTKYHINTFLVESLSDRENN